MIKVTERIKAPEIRLEMIAELGDNRKDNSTLLRLARKYYDIVRVFPDYEIKGHRVIQTNKRIYVAKPVLAHK